MTTSVTRPQRSLSNLDELHRRFVDVRRTTRRLAEPLPVEDRVVQSMENASPTKWHLGHTTWFFETFVLRAHHDQYSPFDERFPHLFNSYYQGVGSALERRRRGIVGRPTSATVDEYRHHVDEAISELIAQSHIDDEWVAIAEVGLHHEQQHQELILTDIKHALASNPLRPTYRPDCASLVTGHETTNSKGWRQVPGGVYEIGHRGPGFAYDNELQPHQVVVDDFQIQSSPVSCGEFIEFIEDGGYTDHRWWLAEGWDLVQTQDWTAPLYWRRCEDRWETTTLGGVRPVDPDEPVCHVSFFEADAFARWAGARLPTEQQWEIASRDTPINGNFVDDDRLHPEPMGGARQANESSRFFGDVWEWTSSSYGPYPGFQPWDETLGEYNGKFMCNQYVLRGGSCATPKTHMRRTYRNYFSPDARWQFSGFRLAR